MLVGYLPFDVFFDRSVYDLVNFIEEHLVALLLLSLFLLFLPHALSIIIVRTDIGRVV